MSDYLPLDLSSLLNAPLEAIPRGAQAPRGATSIRGLPFLIGAADPEAAGNRVIALGEGHAGEPVRIPVGQEVQHLIIAHGLLKSDLWDGGPLAVKAADYLFHLSGGETVQVPIRERFEIGVGAPAWGLWPFLCHPDVDHGTPERYQGGYGNTGQRLTEATMGVARFWYFWVFTPPAAPRLVEALEIRPAGPGFFIAGVTLSTIAEDPFTNEAAVPVVLETTDQVERRGELAVEVDRGVATFPYALPVESVEEFLADPQRGWGQEQNHNASPSVASIAANPSATVTVKHGDQVLGKVNWGQVRDRGEAADDKVTVRLADTGRNWVHTRVVDADSGETLPCRIHFRSPEGIPYAPHGHHPYACSNLASWHQDLGGDVRLGQITYAYIDGTCQGWLPRGEVLVDVARGYEHQPLRARATIDRGQRELVLKLRRVRDMNAERYFSGDSHCHFLSTQGAHVEAAGEGLNVVNLLQSQWGHLYTNTEEFRGEPSVQAGTKTIVYAAQENRQHILGHLTLLNQKRPIYPMCSGGPGESLLGDNLEVTLSRWADACHEQGGTVVLPHIPNPNGEPATMIATGRVDAVEFLREDFYYRNEYYRYLNAGYRLPLCGGTDKMTQDVPVGIYRTYVYIPPDEEFTYDNWCRHLRGGNTFHSGGPLLSLKVDGQMPGDTVRLSGNGGTVTVEAVATSIFPITALQIVRQGRVVASVADPAGTHRLALREELKIDGHTWLAARVNDLDQPQVPHRDGWRRGIMAHTSPVYVAVGGDWQLFDLETMHYMLTLIDGSLGYIRERAGRYPDDHDHVTHHHGHHDHAAWLEEPFHEAREAIHRRMHEMGIPH